MNTGNNNMIPSEDLHMQAGTYPIKHIKRYLPEVRVSFHTEKQCYQAKGRVLQRDEALDPTYQLTSVTTTKTLESPAGAFTVSLVGDQWGARLKPNDLVVIRMGYVGESLHTVMVGLIDRIQTRRSALGGKPSVETTVSGRDFGKMLIKTQLKFYPEIGGTKPSNDKFFLTQLGWIKMLGIFSQEELVEGAPNVILAKIMTSVFPKLNNTKWMVYDEKLANPTPRQMGVTNIVTWDFESTDFFLPFYLTANTFEGSIWNLMERATQKPFTELFIDTYDSENALPKNDMSTASTKKATTTAPAKAQDTYHTVVTGDSLWTLAGTYYKDNTKWRTLWETNKEMLIARDKRNATAHGKWLFPGQKLRIPGVQGVGGAKTPTKTDETYPTTAQSFGTNNGKIQISYRMAPFDASRWNKLRLHHVILIDVLSEELTQSDEEHYNVFWAGTTLTPLGDLNIRTVSPPLMNEEDVKRYGLSPLEVEIEGLAVDRAKADMHKVALENLSNKYSKILKAWYEHNHTHLSGSITVRGNADVRIGERLGYLPKNMEFYIEGVSQNFNVFTEWSTTVTVTRGVTTQAKQAMKDVVVATDKASKTPQPTTTATTTTTATAKAANKDTYHTVVKGDTLWAIAGKHYKDNSKWRVIWEANKEMLIARDKRNATNAGHWIYPGQKLRIPK